jgi:hypothetical protein
VPCKRFVGLDSNCLVLSNVYTIMTSFLQNVNRRRTGSNPQVVTVRGRVRYLFGRNLKLTTSVVDRPICPFHQVGAGFWSSGELSAIRKIRVTSDRCLAEPVGGFRLGAVHRAFGADNAQRRTPSAWRTSSNPANPRAKPRAPFFSRFHREKKGALDH